jgi:hypothetical protein
MVIFCGELDSMDDCDVVDSALQSCMFYAPCMNHHTMQPTGELSDESSFSNIRAPKSASAYDRCPSFFFYAPCFEEGSVDLDGNSDDEAISPPRVLTTTSTTSSNDQFPTPFAPHTPSLPLVIRSEYRRPSPFISSRSHNCSWNEKASSSRVPSMLSPSLTPSNPRRRNALHLQLCPSSLSDGDSEEGGRDTCVLTPALLPTPPVRALQNRSPPGLRQLLQKPYLPRILSNPRS